MDNFVRNKRLKWYVGMLCDITDAIDTSITECEFEQAIELFTDMEEYMQKLKELLKKP